MKEIIYLDNHATTPVDPRVLEQMLPFFTERFGNPASQSHGIGRDAAKAVEKARALTAQLINAAPEEIYFTSGATEANNMAIKGVWEHYAKGETGGRKLHLITQVTEHKSVLEICAYLEKKGVKVTYLPVDENGSVACDAVKQAITDETFLISIMAANNEVGTIQPFAEIGKLAKEKNILFHVDAAQAVGKISMDVNRDGIDLLSWTAHKFYGPKGVGALYIRTKNPRVRLEPMIHGGLHESGLRSGTLNVPGIVGMGAASELASAALAEEPRKLAALRDNLERRLIDAIEDVKINGCLKQRLPGNLNISFAYVEGDGVLMALQNKIALSSSSACSSGNMTPSYVLNAMNVDRKYIHSAIRFGLGRFTTEADIDAAVEAVVKAVNDLRAASPIYQSVREERSKS